MRKKKLLCLIIAIILLLSSCNSTETSTDGDGDNIVTESTSGMSDTVDTPTEPAPTEPIYTDPAPTEPVPTEPAPTEPTPTEPASSESAPTEPEPTEPIEVPAPEYEFTAVTQVDGGRNVSYECGVEITTTQRSMSQLHYFVYYYLVPDEYKYDYYEWTTDYAFGAEIFNSYDALHESITASGSAEDGFLDAFKEYDADYFRENALLVVCRPLPAQPLEYSIAHLCEYDNTLNISIFAESYEFLEELTYEETWSYKAYQINKSSIKDVKNVNIGASNTGFFIVKSEQPTENGDLFQIPKITWPELWDGNYNLEFLDFEPWRGDTYSSSYSHYACGGEVSFNDQNLRDSFTKLTFTKKPPAITDRNPEPQPTKVMYLNFEIISTYERYLEWLHFWNEEFYPEGDLNFELDPEGSESGYDRDYFDHGGALIVLVMPGTRVRNAYLSLTGDNTDFCIELLASNAYSFPPMGAEYETKVNYTYFEARKKWFADGELVNVFGRISNGY